MEFLSCSVSLIFLGIPVPLGDAPRFLCFSEALEYTMTRQSIIGTSTIPSGDAAATATDTPSSLAALSEKRNKPGGPEMPSSVDFDFAASSSSLSKKAKVGSFLEGRMQQRTDRGYGFRQRLDDAVNDDAIDREEADRAAEGEAERRR